MKFRRKWKQTCFLGNKAFKVQPAMMMMGSASKFTARLSWKLPKKEAIFLYQYKIIRLKKRQKSNLNPNLLRVSPFIRIQRPRRKQVKFHIREITSSDLSKLIRSPWYWRRINKMRFERQWSKDRCKTFQSCNFNKCSSKQDSVRISKLRLNLCQISMSILAERV